MTLPPLLDYLYYACLGLTLVAGFLAWFAKGNWWRVAGWLVLALAVVQVVLATAVLVRPPLVGGYESAAMFALWLCLLAVIPCGNRQAQQRLSALCWFACFVVMVLVFLLVNRIFTPNWYMYQHIWTQLFFTLRLAGVSVFLYAALAALASLGAAPDARTTLLRWSRNFLLLGTAVFLAGEFSGFTWRMQWMGDYWCWNANFLESTLYFLLVTAAVHLPPAWAAKPRMRAAALALPGLLMIGMYLNFLLREA
ncbi:MAG: hypothetical protein KQI62_08095 [Deltaproteobacteria bacterium]|nr:hypothetical protein [Deltaproteobacteria bacterium]